MLVNRSSPSSCSSKSVGFPSASGGGSLSAAIFARPDDCASSASRTCHVSTHGWAGAPAARLPRLPGPPLMAPPSCARPRPRPPDRAGPEALALSPASSPHFSLPRLVFGCVFNRPCCMDFSGRIWDLYYHISIFVGVGQTISVGITGFKICRKWKSLETSL